VHARGILILEQPEDTSRCSQRDARSPLLAWIRTVMLLFFRPARFASLALAALLLGAAVPAVSQASEPGGCLKYGAVGAVGGHLAHHGVLGAAGGCAAGMWKRHEYRKSMREKARLYDQEHGADERQAPVQEPAAGDQHAGF
jgi:hypothetical protein